MEPFEAQFQQAQFIVKYLRNELAAQEKEELNNWLAEDEKNQILFEQLTNEKSLQQELIFFNSLVASEAAWQNISEKITEKNMPIVPLRTQKLRWWYAAAAIILLLGFYRVYKFVINKTKQAEIANTQKLDVSPGGNKAILTLADGAKIILDSANNGNIANQGHTKVIKLDGQLAYNAVGKDTQQLYNTITTPRGGQYQLILSDGSKVWLNAESSLRFPATFVGNERKVELTGEGYFEVAKNKAKPFKVKVAGHGEVEVLGTQFNVNAYTDEAAISTTLIEGSVKMSDLNTRNSRLISPGEQARLSLNGQITVNKDVDVEEVIAWKNGQFIFNSVGVEQIMRQIGRWYDVDIVYQGNASKETFSGIVSRSSNVSQLLKIMEQSGMKFRIEGKKIIVLE